MAGTSPGKKVITTNRAFKFTFATLPAFEVAEVATELVESLVDDASDLDVKGNHDLTFAQPVNKVPLITIRIKIRILDYLTTGER